MSDRVTTLYFDESGYTGVDLLNPDQPVFSVASTDIGDDEAAAILNRAFPRYQGAEFKFSRIWARPNHRRRLVVLSEAIGEVAERIFTYVCDKKFTALTKVVDTMTEPIAHDTGHDFYAGGFNRGYVNMFHYALGEFAEPDLYDAVLLEYDRFSRSPTPKTLADLQWRYRLMANSCPTELEPFLGMLALGAEHYPRLQDISRQRGSNDIQLTCVLSSIHFWRTRTEADLAVVHDDSSNFFRQIDQWEYFTSPDVVPGTIVTGDGREVEFPLRVQSTRADDSSASPALQLCDLIAGLSARLSYAKHSDVDPDLRNEIIRAGFGEVTFDGIRPGTQFVDGSPRPIEAPDAIDQINEIITRRRQ